MEVNEILFGKERAHFLKLSRPHYSSVAPAPSNVNRRTTRLAGEAYRLHIAV